VPRKQPVVTTYQKAKRKIRSRTAAWEASIWAASIQVPKGLSPLALYVESEMDSGLSVEFLIKRFQNEIHKHAWSELGTSPTHVFHYCQGCGKIKKLRVSR
jgi:hypothetical protein